MSNSQALNELINTLAKRVESALDQFIPAESVNPSRLHEAIRYSVMGNGKRIRPMLVYCTGQAVSAPDHRLNAPAAAVEMIHAYSLIHDDLPAMDDDDLRRGQPTTHIAFDEASAILAGDALQTQAFQVIAEAADLDVPATTRLRMIAQLAHASGSRGMVGGQAIDLESEGRQLDIAELENMHIHKTGALIRASVMLGALCRDDISEEQLKRLDHYAKCIGLAFQIWDDVLDIVSDTETLGKTQGADIERDKFTYPSLMGLESARERAFELRDEALDSLSDLDDKADPLRWLAEYIVQRQR